MLEAELFIVSLRALEVSLRFATLAPLFTCSASEGTDEFGAAALCELTLLPSTALPVEFPAPGSDPELTLLLLALLDPCSRLVLAKVSAGSDECEVLGKAVALRALRPWPYNYKAK